MSELTTGQTVTRAIMEQCADLPPDAMAELWVGRTLNRDALAKIDAAISAANKPEPAKETEDKESE